MAQSSASRLRTTIAPYVSQRLSDSDAEAFLDRLEIVGTDLGEALSGVYGVGSDSALFEQLVMDAADAAAARPSDLRRLDRRRERMPAWFLSEEVIGYVCYADRFAGDLDGVRRRLDYLDELGVRYLHLMPLLKPREGENDGGYAVEDYDAVDPRLGTMDDLETLAAATRERGIALCVDLVLNHTAREHAWARRAAAGDPAFRDYYLIYPDRTGPDAYERTLPEVFPDMAPGSFTHLPETDEWVWTSFHEFQWDLNWANPEVFRSMLGVVFTLANHGVDVLRLDAAPFLWKRLGTDSQNQPEAHQILQAFKALTRLAMPGVILKAEAIVGPDLLVPYLGGHEIYRPECDLAYDNQLMVMLWSALATRDVRLPVQALGRRRAAPQGTGWVTYVRCHDDIGWAVSDEDAWAVGTNPFDHRRFLAAFYAGGHPGSFGRGADFQSNPATGDVRTSGAAASLAGLDAALTDGDADEVAAAIDRLVLMYSIVYSFGGIPLVYMGDEIALRNDPLWADEPGHEDDNRWMHRPRMDWEAAGLRVEAGSVEFEIFRALRGLGQARRSTPAFRSDADTEVLAVANPHVFGYVRRHRRARPVLCLANFSDGAEDLDVAELRSAGFGDVAHLHSSRDRLEFAEGRLRLEPWGFCWLTRP